MSIIKNITKEFYHKLNISEDTKDIVKEKLLLRIMELVAKDFNLDDTIIYTHRSFNRKLKKELNLRIKKLETEQPTNHKHKKTEVELYLEMINGNYTELRKLGLLNPIELLKAIYLYTICED
mgnify:FL=1